MTCDDEVHALAVADSLVVQAVPAQNVTNFVLVSKEEGGHLRSVHHQQHLLPLSQVHVGGGASVGAARRLARARSGDIFCLFASGGEFRRALEEAILGERAVDVTSDLVTDALFERILRW